MKRLLDVDPLTGTKTYHEYDHLTGQATISTESDVSPILEANNSLYNDSSFKQQGMKNSMLKIASIPVDVIAKWKIEEGIDVFNKAHTPRVMRKLNSPDYRYLRTVSGRY